MLMQIDFQLWNSLIDFNTSRFLFQSFYSYVSLKIIEYFDNADGIRRLFNVLSTLKILQADPSHYLDTHAEKEQFSIKPF